jgi:uncharacterized protein YebE (UPF0316 family)
MTIKSLIFSLISENDGKSLCPIRLFAAAISVPAILFFVIGYSILMYHGHFDLQSMANTFAVLTGGYAALGVSVGLKMRNETQ